MQQPDKDCLNCRRSFQEGETLPPEGIHIEYKKYYLPIKDHQPKWILLKTIIAFLNSKGGTIFMGVDDSTRQVVGTAAQLKEQDMFMLDFAQLLDNIQPQVDLRNKEEVRVRFVPVLKDKTFQGKYIIKIIVKQGHPSKVYHFAQTLKFINQDHKHHDEEFKVLWGFYRSNMGKVDSIKGTQLLRQVFEKAKNPSIVAETYHPGCNPEPLQVSVRNMNIGFKNLKDPELKANILQFIKRKLKALNLQTSYSVVQSQEDDTVILKFKSITEYKSADNCITEHEKQITEMIEGKDTLLDEGYIDNTHFYKIGQAFNPSLRYIRNREKSRNSRSVDIDSQSNDSPNHHGDTSHPVHHDTSHPAHPHRMSIHAQNQTRFKPQNQQSSQNHLTSQNHFVKLKPEDQELQDDDEEEDSQRTDSLSPQIKQKSPTKKFELKPDQFPVIEKPKLSPKDNEHASQHKITVVPPKTSESKNALGNVQSHALQNQKCNIRFSNIYEKSYDKLVNYLKNSLSKELEKIPHRIQENLKTHEVTIHFYNVKQIESFISELTSNPHNKQVFNNFGDGRVIIISVKKGNKIEDLKWNNHQQNKFETSLTNLDLAEDVETPHKKNTINESQQSIHVKNHTPGKSSRMKFAEVKGFPFVISNLRTDLTEVQKMHLNDLLRQIFKKYCTKDAHIQITNQKSLIGIIEIRFQTADQRKHFSDLMQTDIVKYQNFSIYFKSHRAFWGVPTGNIIIHHFDMDEKNQFKEEIDKLFPDQNHSSFIVSSKYIKEEEKNFLRLTFHSNFLVQAMEKLLDKITKSPLKEFASTKDGITVMPEITRL